MSKRGGWFDVDRKGMSMVLSRRGVSYMPIEIIQNAIDAKATEIVVSLEPVAKRPIAVLRVEDNGEGFQRLPDAFTIFAPSLKMENPELRGRFNIGEKLVVSCCFEAKIETTSGTVVFLPNGERKELRHSLDVDTRFTASPKMKRAEIDEALASAFMVIPPENCEITINGSKLERPVLVAEARASLQTEYDDGAGHLKRTIRKTAVKIYRPRDGEQPQLYELGLPVLDLAPYGIRFHVDVQQRVPLDLERSNVPPRFLKHLFKAVLEAVYRDLEPKDMKTPWVVVAMETVGMKKDAVIDVVHKLYGEDAVVFDPSDPEANKIAVSKGYTVVPGNSFSHEAWENIRQAEALLPAGKVTPSPKPFHPNGQPLRMLEQWDDNIKKVVDYARWVAEATGISLKDIRIADDPEWPFLAAYGPRRPLVLNRATLGKRWFSGFPRNARRVTSLLLHELAHENESDHLSEAYANRIADLGARLALAIAEHPEQYKSFVVGEGQQRTRNRTGLEKGE